MLTRNRVYSCVRCRAQCALSIPILKKIPKHYYAFCVICRRDAPFKYTGKHGVRGIPICNFASRKTDKFVCLDCSTIYSSGRRYNFLHKIDKSTARVADLKINCGRCKRPTQFRPITECYYGQLSGAQHVNLALPLAGSAHASTHSQCQSPMAGSVASSPLAVREMSVEYTPVAGRLRPLTPCGVNV